MLPYKDYTLKAQLDDFQQIEQILKEINATFVGLDEQKDYYFETTRGKLKYRKGNIEHLITHYERKIEAGAERTIVYHYDTNPNQTQIESLFQENKQIGFVEKSRQIFLLDNIKIHLDTLPEGQKFIEIEAIDRSGAYSEQALKNQCIALKERLGIPDDKLMHTGYLH